jgi:hypothetical protein
MQHSCSLLCSLELTSRTQRMSVTYTNNSTSFFNCQFSLLINALGSQFATSYLCLIFRMRSTRTANHIFPDCVSLIIMVQIIYELLWPSTPKFSYLQPAVNSSILFPNILQRTPFSSFLSIISKSFGRYLCPVVSCETRRKCP